jgi:hypothetical protein
LSASPDADRQLRRPQRIDEHGRDVAAPPAACWEALVVVLPRAFGGRSKERLASLLGWEQSGSRGHPLLPGSSLPGFRVDRATPPRELILGGAHRFARYELAFGIEELGGGRSRLRAETRAEFPPPWGPPYRARVIGSRGHALVVNLLLRAVAGRAERQGRGGRARRSGPA